MEWKPIKDYDNYEVSNTGLVRNNIGRIIKPYLTTKGYYEVGLYKGKARKHLSIHRLVAEAFVPNLNNLPQVNHIDKDKTNNNSYNLEWCDNSYNQLYRYNNVHTLNKNQILKEYKKGSKEYGLIALSKKYKVSKNTIWRIVNPH